MSMLIDFSSPAEVATFLRRYNEWRRDQSDIDALDRIKMPDPSDISRAIDAAVKMLEGLPHAPDCETCNGRGEIGGFQGDAAPGYVTEACPNCAGAGHAKQQEAEESAAPTYGYSACDTMNSASFDVLAERRRQIEAEGWTPEHDDSHKAGSLARAGGFYALNAGAAMRFGTTDTSICDTAPDGWPWEPGWWKPKDARRDLVKAGALILAEIERLDRIQPPKGED